MRFNVAQQLKETSGSARHYRINELTEALDEETKSPHLVTGELTLLRTDRGVLAMGTLYAAVGAMCGRCLEPFQQQLTLEIEEEYLPKEDVTGGSAPTPSLPEEGFTIDERHTLDLGEALRQAGLLASPMRPICKPECLGLCLSCGRNLNLGSCGCPPVARDPRWIVLETYGQPRTGRPEGPRES